MILANNMKILDLPGDKSSINIFLKSHYLSISIFLFQFLYP